MNATAPKHFYRLEHKTNLEGPYRHSYQTFHKGGFSNIVRYIMDKTNEDFEMSPQRPSPYCDKEKGIVLADKVPDERKNEAIFGFRSMSQTRKWWSNNPAVYALFEKNHFVLRRYKTPERFDARTQSLAFKDALTDGVIIPFSKLLKTFKV